MKTLVVDDDFVSRTVFTDFLSPMGKCDIATNGMEAVWAFNYALQSEKPYNLVCLDIMLPKMDGYHVLEHIKKIEEKNLPWGKGRTKIVMISSLSAADNIIRAFDEECDAYLIKPVQYSELMDKLVELRLLKSSRDSKRNYIARDSSDNYPPKEENDHGAKKTLDKN